MGSGVGDLFPESRPTLGSLGSGKIRVIIDLYATRHSAILVQDEDGNVVRIRVEFGRLPFQCSHCHNYGHAVHRCPNLTASERRHLQADSRFTNPVPKTKTKPQPSTVHPDKPTGDEPFLFISHQSVPADHGSDTTPLQNTDPISCSSKDTKSLTKAKVHTPITLVNELPSQPSLAEGLNQSESINVHLPTTTSDPAMELDGTPYFSSSPEAEPPAAPTSSFSQTYDPLSIPMDQVSEPTPIKPPTTTDLIKSPSHSTKPPPLPPIIDDFSHLTSAIHRGISAATVTSRASITSTELMSEVSKNSQIRRTAKSTQRHHHQSSKSSLGCHHNQQHFKPKSCVDKRKATENTQRIARDEEVLEGLVSPKSIKAWYALGKNVKT